MEPVYPIYIVSKGRANYVGGSTANLLLNKAGIDRFLLVVEKSELADYSATWGKDRCISIPQKYFRDYDPLDGYGQSFPLGSGPARNFVWDLARRDKAKWYWVLDDNIASILRFHEQFKQSEGPVKTSSYQVVRDGRKFFREMELYITQYRNVGMGGPMSESFILLKNRVPRATPNSRIYSFILIRTAIPFRWRGRYNEDTILSLDVLTSGWRTLLLKQWLMKKAKTQSVGGGNTSELYAHGTGPKSRLLARVYPKYTSIDYRFGRIHHYINYRKHFGHLPLVLEADFDKQKR